MSSTDGVLLTSVIVVSCDGQNAKRKNKSGGKGKNKAAMSDESRDKVVQSDKNFARCKDMKKREEDVKRRQEQEDDEQEKDGRRADSDANQRCPVACLRQHRIEG